MPFEKLFRRRIDSKVVRVNQATLPKFPGKPFCKSYSRKDRIS